MAVVALVAVFLADGLPLPAGGTEELHMRRVTTRYQAAQHTQTAAGERVDPCAHFDVSFVFFDAQLTEVGIAKSNAPECASTHPCSQQHSDSASERADSITPCALHVFMLLCSLTSDSALLHTVDERIEV